MHESMFRFSKLLALVGLIAFAGACGDDNNDNNNGGGGTNRTVTVTGNASIFPVAAQVLAQAHGGTYDPGDLSNLEVRLASAARELQPNNTTFLGDSPQPLTDAAGLNATWSVPNVNADDVGIAIIAHLEPVSGASGAILSHRVTTGVLSADDIPAGNLPTTLDTSVNGAPAFIVPTEFEGILAQATGNDATALATNGYILAFAVAGQTPLPGATITLKNGVTGADVTSQYTIRYPTFTGPPGASTGASGLAVITGPESAAPLTITATAGTTVHSGQGGIKPATTFVAPLLPQ